jgi:uroporphyrin-III C-methyltransferase / precorrin-2 dehydrogenase / sirohydrochlorin ferrochelatase
MQVASRQPSDPGSPLIQPLSILPVFFDLTGKRAVVADGTEGAE